LWSTSRAASGRISTMQSMIKWSRSATGRLVNHGSCRSMCTFRSVMSLPASCTIRPTADCTRSAQISLACRPDFCFNKQTCRCWDCVRFKSLEKGRKDGRMGICCGLNALLPDLKVLGAHSRPTAPGSPLYTGQSVRCSLLQLCRSRSAPL
jgi:hypothetical protein